MSNKMEKYWRERCEAAEEHITILCNYPKGKITTAAWKKWQELKSTPIPILTPCVEWVCECKREKGFTLVAGYSYCNNCGKRY